MTHRCSRVWLLAAVCAAGTLSACAGRSHHALRAARYPNTQAQAGLSPEERSSLERNCGPFGWPQKDPAWGFPRTRTVTRPGYALEHNSVDKIPLWVCEAVTPEQLGGSERRNDRFQPDPKLPAGERSELKDYKGSGFSRGHMAPAGDQTRDPGLKLDTFFLSNMAPQLQRHNAPTWSGLEDLVRRWVEDGTLERAHVITGGFFYDPAEENPATADGQIAYRTIGANEVAVPTHFYKIVLGRATAGWRAIAFVIEHRDGIGRVADYKPFVQSIDWVEERTGLDFLPDLSAGEENRLEKTRGSLF